MIMLASGLTISCSNADYDTPSEMIGGDSVSTDTIDEDILRLRESLAGTIGIEHTTRVDELVADHIAKMHPYVRFRTYRDEAKAMGLLSREISEASDIQRQRIVFDLTVQKALFSADEMTGFDKERVQIAFDISIAACAKEHGINDVSLLLYPSPDDVTIFDSRVDSTAIEPTNGLPSSGESQFALDALDRGELDGHPNLEVLQELRDMAAAHHEIAESLGFTSDELLDLRHACSRYAATLPSLDPLEREEMINQIRNHYLHAAYTTAATYPLDVREVCRAADDPQECALSEGVTLE